MPRPPGSARQSERRADARPHLLAHAPPPEVDWHAPPRKLTLLYHDADLLWSSQVPEIEFDALVLIRYPDPRLRARCRVVEEFDEEIAALARRMIEIMHAAQGVGLAAPQVGVPKRIFVCNPGGEPGGDRVLVNPILESLDGDVTSDEGCLSIPDITVMVRRAKRCRLRARGLRGEEIDLSGEDIVARCWQHECDHLDGRLIIDYMSEADRIANRRALKNLEAQFNPKGKRR